MNHTAAAGIYADMRNPGRSEKHQIAGTPPARTGPEIFSCHRLISGIARQRDPVQAVYTLYQSGAIDAAFTDAAPLIGDAQKTTGSPRHQTAERQPRN